MATNIQALIFDRDHFTVWQAAAWAKKHGFKAKIDSAGGVLRAQQFESSPHDRYRTIPLRPGVQSVVRIDSRDMGPFGRAERSNPDVAGAILAALKANADPRFLAFLNTFESMIREAIAEVVAEEAGVEPTPVDPVDSEEDLSDLPSWRGASHVYTKLQARAEELAKADWLAEVARAKKERRKPRPGVSEDAQTIQQALARGDEEELKGLALHYLDRDLEARTPATPKKRGRPKKSAEAEAFGVETIPIPKSLHTFFEVEVLDGAARDESGVDPEGTEAARLIAAGLDETMSKLRTDRQHAKQIADYLLRELNGIDEQIEDAKRRRDREALSQLPFGQRGLNALGTVIAALNKMAPLPVLQLPPREVSTVRVADDDDHDGKLTFIWSAHDPNEGQWTTQPRFPQADLFKSSPSYKLLANYTVRGILDLYAKEVRHALDLRLVHVEDGWFGPDDVMILAEYADISTQARFWRVGRYDAKEQTLWIDSTWYSATTSRDLIRQLLIANWPIRGLRQQIEELKDFPDPNHRNVMERQGWDFLMKLADPLRHSIYPVAASHAIQTLWHMDRMGAKIRRIVEQDQHDAQAHTKINALIGSIDAEAHKLGDETNYSVESTQIGEDWMKEGESRAADNEGDEGELLAALSSYTREAEALERELRTDYPELYEARGQATETGVPGPARRRDLKLQISRVVEGAKQVNLTLQDGDGKIQELEAAGIDVTNTPEGYDWDTLKAAIVQGQDEGDLPADLANIKYNWLIIEISLLVDVDPAILSAWLNHAAEDQVDLTAVPGFLDMTRAVAVIPEDGSPIFLRRGAEISVVKNASDIARARKATGMRNGLEEAARIIPAKVLGHVLDVVKKPPTSYIKGFAHTLSEDDYDELLKRAEGILDDIPSLTGNLSEFTLSLSKKEKDALIAADENLRAIEDQTEGRLQETDDLGATLRGARHQITRAERVKDFIESYLADHKGAEWKETGWEYLWSEVVSDGIQEDEYLVVTVEDHPELGKFGVFIDDNTYWIKREHDGETGSYSLSRADARGAVNLLDLMSKTTLWDWGADK